MEKTIEGPTISLRFHSRTLTVAKLSERLGVEPTESHEIGSLLSKTSKVQRVRNEMLWVRVFQYPTESRLEDCIDRTLQFLEERSDVIKALHPDVTLDLFCAAALDVTKPAMCLSLDCALIQRLATLRMDLLIDVIPE